MAVAVVTIAAGGLPVVDVTATKPALGLPVTEAVNGRGIPVTKVSLAIGGLPVTFVATGNEWPPSGGGAITPATLDGTPSSATLSNGNLTVTHSTAFVVGGGRSTAYKSSGKYYFEVTIGVRTGNNDAVSLQPSSANYSAAFAANANVSCMLNTTYWSGQNINANGGGAGRRIAPIVTGDKICAAIDMDNKNAWFRVNNGLWNGLAIGSENPVGNVGGITGWLTPGAFAPMLIFDSGNTGETYTANFGATAFAYAVPAGFTAGWPA